MIPLPLNTRCWAALCHLSVIFWIFFLYLFFQLLLPFLGAIDIVKIKCLFKPFPECKEEAFFILFLMFFTELLLLWSLPYISVLVVKIMLHVKGKTHPFIKIHAREALDFQLRLASFVGIFHLACMCILLILTKPYKVRAFASTMFLILLFDYFFFSVFAILQLLATLIAVFHSMRGLLFKYLDIKKMDRKIF